MEVVRKAIVVGKCCILCRTHLQMFSVSTVLGEKAFRRGAFQRGICRSSRPSPNATLDRRGQLNEGVMFGELRVLLFVLVVCMGGWEWTCE